MGRKKKFYTRDEFSKTKDLGKAIADTSCVVLQRKADGGLDECINRAITNDIVAFTKFFVTDGNDAFTANISSSLAAEVGLSEKQVFRCAIKSMQKKHPFELAEIDGGDYILHTGMAFGASSLLYDGVLPHVAEELGGDYYIFPVSEDYLKVIRKAGIPLPMAKIYASADELKSLSDEIFVYYKDHDLIRIIGDRDENVIYLQKGVMKI